MFNILLDKLPSDYRGFPIDSDFQVGIQIMQALENRELSGQEGQAAALALLFLQEDAQGNKLPLPDARTALEGLVWFLTDWNHDHNDKGDKTKVTDYDIDQWRIYAAFRQYYGINLNDLGRRCVGYKLVDGEVISVYEENRLHFWEFMGLLTSLPECAYTRVVDIRARKITPKMGKEEKKAYIELKKVYALDNPRETAYTDSQKDAIDDFDRMMEEQKKIRESRRLAAEAFKDMVM